MAFRLQADRALSAPGAPLVVVNGAVTHGIPRSRLAEALGFLGAACGDVEVVETHDVAEFGDVWASAEARRLVLVGGDGTIHAAANFPGPAREVALIPCGSANNVARSLGIPVDPLAAAELAAFGRCHPLDLIEARTAGTSYRVVESVSVGFLADARAHYHASGSGHRVAGALAGAQALSRFRPLAVHVGGAMGRGEELALSQLFVANLPLFEFGLHVAPHADPRDGMLDFVGFEGRTRRDVLAMMHHLHAGDHLGREGVHIWRAEGGRIRPRGLSPVIADSTNLGSGPVDLEVVRDALRLVRPG